MPLTVDKIVGKTANSDRMGNIRPDLIAKGIALVLKREKDVPMLLDPIRILTGTCCSIARILSAPISLDDGIEPSKSIHVVHKYPPCFSAQ